MKRLKSILIAFILFQFLSCSHSDHSGSVISGNLSAGTGIKMILEEMEPRSIRLADSLTIDEKGHFVFNFLQTEPGFWLLKEPGGKILVLLMNPGDHVDISGSFNNFPDSVTVSGAQDAMLLHQFFADTRKLEHRVDSIEMMLIEFQDSTGYYALTQKADTMLKLIWEQQRTYEHAFIRKNPGSLASLIVLNYSFGVSPVLSPAEDRDLYHMVDSALKIRYSENKHVKYHHQRMQELQTKTDR